MKQLTKDMLDDVLRKMHEMVGAQYDRENCKADGWYLKHSWPPAVEQDWLDWGIKYLRSKRFTKRDAERIMSMLVLNFGWKTENLCACCGDKAPVDGRLCEECK
jgi:hypothetical protein